MNEHTVKTSRSDPLLVNWLEPGRPVGLGITIAPGKHTSSQGGFRWERDLEMDLEVLQREHQVGVLVNLLLDEEMGWLGISGLVSACAARGIPVYRLPIRDGGVMKGHEGMHALCELVAPEARLRRVVVHCQGGLGRAGTMAACLLVHEGASAEEALQAVKRARGPRSPETTQQHDFVRDYEQWLRGRTAGGDRAQSREAALQVLERHGGGFTPPRPPTAGRVTDTREDAIAGAVLGAAIGDAMGAPTEFLSMEAIRGRFGHSGVQGFVEYREVNGQRVALYTDDTQMAEAVALGLLEARDARGDLDVTMTSIARRFVAWAEHPQGGHRAPGNACLSGCRALAAGIPWREAGGPKAGGCGSVMRAYPFGLLFHADLDRAEAWSVEHSKLTHRDPIALAACAAMTVGMALVIREKRPGEVTAAMVAAAARHDGKTAAMMRQAVEEARAGIGPEVTLDRLRAWAAHEAIAAAVYIVERHPEDARSAILEGANTPGDSDSIATLAGALVGGRVGLAGLPEEWVRDVERSDELRALARRVGVDGVGW